MNEHTDYARLLRWRLLPPQQRPVEPYGTTTKLVFKFAKLSSSPEIWRRKIRWQQHPQPRRVI